MSILPALLLQASLSAPSAAPSTEPPLALEWTAPPLCPQRDAVSEAVAALLAEVDAGRPSTPDDEPEVRASALVEETPAGGYILHLTFAGAGVRDVPGETCESIAEVAALLLAIAIDPRVMGGEPEPAAELDPPPSAIPQPDYAVEAPQASEEGAPPEESVLPEERDPAEGSTRGLPSPADTSRPAPPSAPTPWTIGLRALAGVGVGVLPSPAAFAGLSLGVEGRYARIELHGSYAGPARETSAVNPEVAGRFALWRAGVRGCGIIPLTAARSLRLSAPLCLGLDAGAMRGRGEGSVVPRTATSPWLGLSLAAALRAQLHPSVALWIDAEGLLSALRPSFHTDPSGPLWRASRFGGRFGLGLELRFDLQNAGRRGQ